MAAPSQPPPSKEYLAKERARLGATEGDELKSEAAGSTSGGGDSGGAVSKDHSSTQHVEIMSCKKTYSNPFMVFSYKRVCKFDGATEYRYK